MAVICAVTFMGCEKDEQESFKFIIGEFKCTVFPIQMYKKV